MLKQLDQYEHTLNQLNPFRRSGKRRINRLNRSRIGLTNMVFGELCSAEGQFLGRNTTLEQLIHEVKHFPFRALQNSVLDEFDMETRMSQKKDGLTLKRECNICCLLCILGVSKYSCECINL